MKKLYIVEFTRTAYVLAENENDAFDMRHEVEKWEPSEAAARPWGGEHLPGWDDDCIVYCDGADIKLPEAKAIDAASRQTDPPHPLQEGDSTGQSGSDGSSNIGQCDVAKPPEQS